VKHLKKTNPVFRGKTGRVDLFVGSALTGKAFKVVTPCCKGECVGSYSEVIHILKTTCPMTIFLDFGACQNRSLAATAQNSSCE
jgi:hypothetical protein